MPRLLIFSFIMLWCLSASVWAQDTDHQQLDPDLKPTQASYEEFLKELGISNNDSVPEQILQEDFNVTLRVLDRHLSKTTDIVLQHLGGKVFENTLLISVSSCIEEHDNIPGNDAAFVTIRDKAGAVLFNGWMLRNFPSASVFEHTVYDVLMRKCSPAD